MAKVEYEGRAYETEPSGEAHYCKNCGKRLRENWIFESYTHQSEEPRMVSRAARGLIQDGTEIISRSEFTGRKLYTRAYGYGWHDENLFCTLRCGYYWACQTFPHHSVEYG
ncbi:hypothetical protein CMI37_38545 [Candidatus Pacearchaeota archaeon]|nr:hypothetical protein [Candidatus Pacearchaeota archaeon]